jgi:formate/nitrite transporter FocA (FNT family)
MKFMKISIPIEAINHIMAFVTLGFEHSVANMFFIPLGIFYGADVTWTQFFVVNLIPVTFGNIVGGSFFVGTICWFVYEYEKPGKIKKRLT